MEGTPRCQGGRGRLEGSQGQRIAAAFHGARTCREGRTGAGGRDPPLEAWELAGILGRGAEDAAMGPPGKEANPRACRVDRAAGSEEGGMGVLSRVSGPPGT